MSAAPSQTLTGLDKIKFGPLDKIESGEVDLNLMHRLERYAGNPKDGVVIHNGRRIKIVKAEPRLLAEISLDTIHNTVKHVHTFVANFIWIHWGYHFHLLTDPKLSKAQAKAFKQLCLDILKCNANFFNITHESVERYVLPLNVHNIRAMMDRIKLIIANTYFIGLNVNVKNSHYTCYSEYKHNPTVEQLQDFINEGIEEDCQAIKFSDLADSLLREDILESVCLESLAMNMVYCLPKMDHEDICKLSLKLKIRGFKNLLTYRVTRRFDFRRGMFAFFFQHDQSQEIAEAECPPAIFAIRGTQRYYEHEGFGDSMLEIWDRSTPGAGLVVPEKLEFLAELFNSCKGKVILIGHSMGANIATRMAYHSHIKDHVIRIKCYCDPGLNLKINLYPGAERTVSTPIDKMMEHFVHPLDPLAHIGNSWNGKLILVDSLEHSANLNMLNIITHGFGLIKEFHSSSLFLGKKHFVATIIPPHVAPVKNTILVWAVYFIISEAVFYGRDTVETVWHPLNWTYRFFRKFFNL